MKAGFKKLILLSVAFSIFQFCTNYSTSKQRTVPPILISVSNLTGISAIPSGYLITMRAGNPEIFFLGYRLYVGNTESASRNPADLNQGFDCDGGIKIIPNQPLEYSAEVSPKTDGLSAVNPGENANRICKFTTTVTTGQYLTLRSLLRSQTTTGTSINISAPSNSLIVP